MRTVFLGTPELAVPSLAAVAERHEVAAVVCQPDKPRGRSKRPAPPPVKEWAVARGLPVHQPVRLNDGGFEAWLRALAPEVCVVVAYGRLLKQPILDVPRHGYLNMHPSLLPRYRGPSPIQSAVLNGETIIGVSVMRLNLDMDAGDVVLQESVAVGPDENAAELSGRLAELGARLLVNALDLVGRGQARFTPQEDDEATYCRLFEKADGRIDWRASAQAIHNQVRACQPWPVAHCQFRGAVCRIHRTERARGENDGDPGVITRVESDRLVAATGEGALAVTELQMPGKRAMAVAEFLRGQPVKPGERFEPIEA